MKLAEAVGYIGAGTMEYLVDDRGNYYFMEMNTRIQVEHTITEEAYGIDLVKEQIKIAAGEHLSHFVRNAERKYHAIECRVNAEDPFNGFQPSPGRIDLYYAPGGRGLRIDSHAYSGYAVPPHYDSMIAKVIAMGTSRDNAIARMRRALERVPHPRHQDDDPVSAFDHARSRFPPREIRYEFRRPPHPGARHGIRRVGAAEDVPNQPGWRAPRAASGK